VFNNFHISSFNPLKFSFYYLGFYFEIAILYIYIYIYMCVCVCVDVLIKVYFYTFRLGDTISFFNNTDNRRIASSICSGVAVE